MIDIMSKAADARGGPYYAATIVGRQAVLAAKFPPKVLAGPQRAGYQECTERWHFCDT